ncbi:GmrSD restriction endonuclease domain-containing protein [Tardiphaga sp. 619_E2_N8_5]|uniref:GmrSD restriction endonuclease domain-containing protein n=1 Tax=unclassified Tardiphaga TaxID=2631404 RepID=UPI003F24780F
MAKLPDSTAQTSATIVVPSRAPEPTVDRIEELAGRILRGDILLPKFQRDFVWEKHQIIDLLDSIANNYPIGSVLLWRSRELLRSERSIADLEIAPTQQDYPVNYLLDGQQRLSTICGALYWQGGNPNSRWNLAFDLREKTFLHLTTSDDPPLHHLRLNKLTDPSAYFKHVSSLSTLQASDVTTLEKNAKELFDRFKDYKVATVTLHEMSIEAVAPIFERINSRGTPLTIVDLMRAATWSETFDLIDAITSINDELSAKYFGGIERKAILRSISAAAGGGFSEASIDLLRKHSSDELEAAVVATKDAFSRAVDFMTTELHIPSDKQVPYVNQVVVLAEVFRLIKHFTPEQLAAVRTWFWRTAVAGYFGGWNTGNMSSDQKAVQLFAAGRASTIDSVVQDPGPGIWSAQQFRSNAAHSKILILLLAFTKPTDLLTSQKIDTGDALFHGNTKEFHHFFPRDYLVKNKGVAVRKANVLGNFVMLTAASNKRITNRAPSDYLKEVVQALGSKLNEVLASNLVSPEAFQAAMNDDYDAFLGERAKTITAAVSNLTGW